MCGRYNLRLSPAEVQEMFDTVRAPAWEPRYNVAPTQDVLVVRRTDAGRDVGPMRWGLIPAWSKEPKTKFPLINARAETVATKPSFRTAFAKRRCLLPATGFYEWKTLPDGKQPYHVHLPNDEPFAFAGLWERWGEGAEAIESCTILTTEANSQMAELHERMPLILDRAAHDPWIDPDVEPAGLEKLLVPREIDDLVLEPISKAVNNVRNEGPELLRGE